MPLRYSLILLMLAFAASAPASRVSADLEDERLPVLVFGIDGATWRVLDPMLDAGELPHLKRHFDAGIHGVLRSRPPVISPVSWTTIFTGQLPERHGVENWKTSQSTHRRVKALWNITSDAGLVTHVFNVPSTWPPEPVEGVMLSGFPLSGSHVGNNTGVVVSSEGLGDPEIQFVYRDNVEIIRASMADLEVGAWSPWFDVEIASRDGWLGRMKVKRLGEDSYYLSPFYRSDEDVTMSYPTRLRAAVSDRLGEQYIPEGPGWSKHADPETPEYLYEHLVEVSRMQTRAASMFAGAYWDVFIYIDTLVDRVSHPYWAYMRPHEYDGLDARKADKYREAVRNAYRETDRQLGELLSKIDGEYYFVVVSDHGFHSNANKSQYIGTHEFDGVYLFSGPGLEGQEGPVMNIEDVTPTILYLLDMPYADDMMGDVPHVFVEMLGHSPPQIASYETGGREGSEVPVDEATWRQLQGLGYVGDDPDKDD
jgi:predicted AlkP superfamily phosphohydrolase/phosphomutase